MDNTFKSGFVTLIGRPNVGKSTLMNYLIGQKIAITSDKPQTTRNRIQTVYTDERGQIIFLDTPGIHKAKNKLGEYMVNVAEHTMSEVDVILWLVEPTTFIGAGERHIAEQLQKVKTPVMLVINKIDTVKNQDEILKFIDAYKDICNFAEIVPVSALKGKNTELVTELIFKYLPEGPQFYDEDTVTDQPMRQIAAELIREKIHCADAAVHFFPGATQANFIVTAAALSPVQSVIAADTGHINCHEAASIENTGHKILELPNTDGKISAEQIAACAAAYYEGGEPEYLTEPKMVYLSFPTEQGTLYSLQELTKIHEVCRKYDMYLFVDGARLGYGLGSEKNDVSLEDLAALTDVFYFGGTKCGALFGEAVVLTADSLKKRFKAYMKQNGAVLAKGWLLGLQFHCLLGHDLYFTATRRADELAMKLRKAFAAQGIPFWVESFTNQQFVILTDAQKETLEKRYIFEPMGKSADGGNIARFCTSWATTEEEVQTLIDDLKAL